MIRCHSQAVKATDCKSVIGSPNLPDTFNKRKPLTTYQRFQDTFQEPCQ